MSEGRIAGIALHRERLGPMETLEEVVVSVDHGLEGDARGSGGSKRKRQVSLIEAASWEAAMDELGLEGEARLPWYARRANLLVEGLRLPREPGARIELSDSLVLEVTVECDPCSRMEALHPGLRAALAPDWRGGVLTRVLKGGAIGVGDAIRIRK